MIDNLDVFYSVKNYILVSNLQIKKDTGVNKE